MNKKSYSEKLKDPRWQDKRNEILERDNHRCQLCGDNTEPLHVHHKYYQNFKEPWDYPNESLITLCEKCHNSQHNKEDERLRERLSELTTDYLFNFVKTILLKNPGFILEFNQLSEKERDCLLSEMYNKILYMSNKLPKKIGLNYYVPEKENDPF
jgi:hypothetical protein